MTKTPTRLLIVHQGAELYGSDRMALACIDALLDSMAHITVHVPNQGPLLTALRQRPVSIILAPISILRRAAMTRLAWLNIVAFLRQLLFAWRQLRRHDMVIVNTCVVIGYIILLPFYRQPKFIYLHEITRGLVNLVFNLLFLISGATIICNSHATRQTCWLIPARRKIVVHNTANAQPDPAPPTPRHPLRKPLHVLLPGRLNPGKGQHVLLHALRMLPPAAIDEIMVRVVGDSFDPSSPYPAALTALAHDLPLTFHSFTPDMADHYGWADVVVMPSIQPESFGLVALEAMQQKRAVIASHIGALPEIVIADDTGLLITPNDPAALAQALQTYCQDRSLCDTHGENGSRRFTHMFTPSHYQQMLQQVIHA